MEVYDITMDTNDIMVQGPNQRKCTGVRTKDGGGLYWQYHYQVQLLCMKGDENQVKNSTIKLPRNLYSLYRECMISEEA